MIRSPVLAFSHIAKGFPLPDGSQLPVLRDVQLELYGGDVVAIIGKSGSGKSTLLNLIGLLDTPDTGTYVLNGVDTAGLNDRQRAALRAESLGFVFQQFFLIEGRSALENVAEPLLYASSMEMSVRHDRARHMLERVGLAHRSQARPDHMSGGEQQRVAIARALIRQPRVILADEPTGSLDEETGEHVLALLLETARSAGASLILVTHDHDVAVRADRILRLDGGSLHEVLHV